MKHVFLPLALTLVLAACGPDESSYVNPRIGSGGHGHVFVGAHVPFGLVQLGPTSIPQEWDWCSGYHDSDSTVIGFSHTHLSGTGIGDLFDVTLMPVTGDVTYARGSEDDPQSGLWSYADRTREISEPGYYSVPLTRYGIRAEMTATVHAGLHRYTYPETERAAVVIDLENGGCWDRVSSSSLHPVSTDPDGGVRAVAGYRFSSGWARDQKIWFHAEFSRPCRLEKPREHYARLDFSSLGEGEQILVKVGLSTTGEEAAGKNLSSEIPGWKFDEVRADAREAWNRELGKIRIRTRDPRQRTIFYTALYHTATAPSLFSDNGAEMRYTTFSLWDTYRAAMPLMTLIQPERMDDIQRTFYHIFQEQGDLPVWHLMGNETDCMVGNPGLIAFADNIVKGFDGGLTPEQSLHAMTRTATREDRGQDLRMRYGFIPSDLYRESVATDMEYAIADAALAHAAEALGDAPTAARYLERSRSYRHFWDPETRFMRGRRTDGRFSEPFNPFGSDHQADDYTEGTPWQYIWLVPHDVEGLAGLFGSREALLAKLDSLFEVPSVIEGDNVSPDISGLIGQYAHGNEPGHHTIYLYSMLGEPDKAADRLRQVYREMYTDTPEGLSGNEDVGQMSAWYILSVLGFYQVEPASTRFWFGAPALDEAVLQVSGGTFTIRTRGLSAENRYIRGVKLNGRPYDLPYIDYRDIVRGGTLEFIMGQ